jgi:hypothetical protein
MRGYIHKLLSIFDHAVLCVQFFFLVFLASTFPIYVACHMRYNFLNLMVLFLYIFVCYKMSLNFLLLWRLLKRYMKY